MLAASARDFLDDIKRAVLRLVVEPAQIFAHQRQDEHLDRTEHDHDQHQRRPAGDGAARKPTDQDVGDDQHRAERQPQAGMARKLQRR